MGNGITLLRPKNNSAHFIVSRVLTREDEIDSWENRNRSNGLLTRWPITFTQRYSGSRTPIFVILPLSRKESPPARRFYIISWNSKGWVQRSVTWLQTFSPWVQDSLLRLLFNWYLSRCMYMFVESSPDLALVRASGKPRDIAIVTLLLHMGLRVSELCA